MMASPGMGMHRPRSSPMPQSINMSPAGARPATSAAKQPATPETTVPSSTSKPSPPAKTGAGTPKPTSTPTVIRAAVGQHRPMDPQPVAQSSSRPNNTAQGALVGVGMEFDSQRMIITSLRPGCAAAYSKQITIGDQIVAVDGEETYDFKRARDLILGTQGTFVPITFKKNGSAQRFTVSLLRGTADYVHMAERCKHLDAHIAQLEAENKKLTENVGKGNLQRLSSDEVKAHVSAQVNIGALQKKVAELETENAELQHAMKNRSRTNNGPTPGNAQVAQENEMLQKQVAQLQKLIGEKDAQIHDVKAKSRDLQSSLARRLKDLEEVLKDRVEAKNERIVELNKQLLDSRAETEGLRTENQSLRNVVQQTNQKLNALISIQIENADRGGDAVNEELRMLRSKTATLEAEIQRIKSPAPRVQGTGKSPAHMGARPTAEHPLEVAGLQAEEEDDEHAGAHEYNEIPGPYSKHAGNGDRKLPRTDSGGVEVSTRPNPHSFLPPAQTQTVQPYVDVQRLRTTASSTQPATEKSAPQPSRAAAPIPTGNATNARPTSQPLANTTNVRPTSQPLNHTAAGLTSNGTNVRPTSQTPNHTAAGSRTPTSNSNRSPNASVHNPPVNQTRPVQYGGQGAYSQQQQQQARPATAQPNPYGGNPYGAPYGMGYGMGMGYGGPYGGMGYGH